jgi:excisionase family DNA binding protein
MGPNKAVVKPISIPTTESELPMAGENVTEKKRPGRVTIAPEEKFLVGRVEAADMLSISRRALDYLVANKLLTARRIGSRVLIPVADLRRFSRGDHPARLAG